jgi:hypothetical protein
VLNFDWGKQLKKKKTKFSENVMPLGFGDQCPNFQQMMRKWFSPTTSIWNYGQILQKCTF